MRPPSLPKTAKAIEISQANVVGSAEYEAAQKAELEALSPEEQKKQQLMEDPTFLKFAKAYKMKIPLTQIR